MRFLLLISVLTWHVTNSNVLGRVITRQDVLRLVTHSANTFAPNFFEAVADNVKGNFICSPISASLLLTMVTYGARGNTEKQLRAALGLSEDDYLAQRGFQVFTDNINNYKNIEFILANKMYHPEGFKPKTEFTDIIRTAFQSEVEALNFHNTVNATRRINDWCETRTKNHIKDLFRPHDIKGETFLVLVNAVYFRGNWAKPFNPAETKQQINFHVNSNTIRKVEMMTKFDDFIIGEIPGLDATFLELPYKTEEFVDSVSMFIILPKKYDVDLAKLEKNIKKFTVDKLPHGASRKVYVGLPKFQIKSVIPFQESLVQMGVTDMFNDKANFTGILDFPPLQVSKIVQKVFIDVNEKGSEAATASGSVSLPRTITPDGPQFFYANHPFISIIATKGKNPVNLFIARYAGPH